MSSKCHMMAARTEQGQRRGWGRGIWCKHPKRVKKIWGEREINLSGFLTGVQEKVALGRQEAVGCAQAVLSVSLLHTEVKQSRMCLDMLSNAS